MDARYDGVVLPTSQQPLPGPADAGVQHGTTIGYTVPAFAAVVLDLDGTSSGPTLSAAQVTKLITAAAAHNVPVPALAVGGQGQVAAATVQPGQSESLTATATSN